MSDNENTEARAAEEQPLLDAALAYWTAERCEDARDSAVGYIELYAPLVTGQGEPDGETYACVQAAYETRELTSVALHLYARVAGLEAKVVALRAEVAALKARRAVACTECDGAGTVPDPTRAYVEWMWQTWGALVFCAECHSTGVVLALVCQACKGSGEVETDTVLNYDAADGSYTVPRGTCWECGGTGVVLAKEGDCAKR